MLTAIEIRCDDSDGPSDPLHPRPAVFLDRDGTIIEDAGFIRDPRRVRVLPGAIEALRRLQEAACQLVVVSNQSGVARGIITESQLLAVHERFVNLLADADVRLAACYYCPYHPAGSVAEFAKTSDARKPAPGMLLHAARALGLFLPGSWMIGDRWDDVATARRAGVRSIKLPDPPDGRDRSPDLAPDFFADSLAAAATIILNSPAISGGSHNE